jgi:membrane protein implicated in regulation of membrane protease activity
VMFAGGAAAGAITAAAGGPVGLQFIVAIAATLALLLGVRPVAKRHLTAGTGARTGTDALVGKEAIVLSEVDGHNGRVRLNGGEWSARSFDRAQVLPAGTVVRVMEISGATAVVWQEPPF